MTLDETYTLDMTNGEYLYQIELMNTVPMLTHLAEVIDNNTSLIAKLPAAFAADYAIDKPATIDYYLAEVIALVNRTWPTHWGYKVNDPLTSPVASVSNIQFILSPRAFIVQSVIK